MPYQIHSRVVQKAVLVFAEHGFARKVPAMQLLINECTKIERRQAIGEGPC